MTTSSAPESPSAPTRTASEHAHRAAPAGRHDGTHPARLRGASRGRTGRVVAGSLATGLLAAALLVLAPFVPPTEAGVTGAVLCGWALGWALLALLSRRCTDQPQPWAAVPALFMGLSGLLLVVLGSSAQPALAWVWPPTLLALVVWIRGRARRQLRSPARRWLLHPVLGVLAIASLGGGYQTVSEAVEARVPAPGQLVDVGGHRLHLHCTGSGSPTVVLEPGAGASSSQLGLITPAVARDTRVCVYDRAGRGWSEPADTPQDAARTAADLHTALHRARVPGPFVLAGHSFGGLYALTFAARHPEEVVGMVLVDSTAPVAEPAGAAPAGRASSDLPDRLSALASASARLGLGRPLGAPTAQHLRSAVDEYLQGESSMRQAAALRDLGDTPLVVLTAGRGSARGWSAEQDALAALSSDSAHRVVEDVDHAGLVVDERGAAATTRAVLDVVSSIRTGLPLSG
jgi:pimeloyl-ACP methyl ester carboxylesterase